MQTVYLLATPNQGMLEASYLLDKLNRLGNSPSNIAIVIDKDYQESLTDLTCTIDFTNVYYTSNIAMELVHKHSSKFFTFELNNLNLEPFASLYEEARMTNKDSQIEIQVLNSCEVRSIYVLNEHMHSVEPQTLMSIYGALDVVAKGILGGKIEPSSYFKKFLPLTHLTNTYMYLSESPNSTVHCLSLTHDFDDIVDLCNTFVNGIHYTVLIEPSPRVNMLLKHLTT